MYSPSILDLGMPLTIAQRSVQQRMGIDDNIIDPETSKPVLTRIPSEMNLSISRYPHNTLGVFHIQFDLTVIVLIREQQHKSFVSASSSVKYVSVTKPCGFRNYVESKGLIQVLLSNFEL